MESGIADIDELWDIKTKLPAGGMTLEYELGTAFGQRKKLAGYRGPVLVLHAAHDKLVSVSHAERLHDWAGGAGKRLAIYPRGNHNSILIANLPDYTRDVTAFLRQTAVVSPSLE